MDCLCVAKILKVSTFILAKVRFEPKKDSTKHVLQLLRNYYEQSLDLWDFDNFLQLFSVDNPFNSYDDFCVSVEVILKKIVPTNNIQEIEKYSTLISQIAGCGCTLFEESKYDQLYDLIDLLHALPEALLFKEMWDSEKYFKTYLNPYRKKWNKKFIKAEQKLLQQKASQSGDSSPVS